MTVDEISRQSGLRQDLVSAFVPGMDTPTGKLYSANHVVLARYVKELTDLNAPEDAIQLAVQQLKSRPDTELRMVMAQRPARPKRARRWAGIGAVAGVALLVGGIIGSFLVPGKGVRGSTQTAAPVTVTAPAGPSSLNPTIPVTPDPVCAEWSPISQDYLNKEADWAAKSDPKVAMAQRPPEVQALTTAVIPVLKSEAADMRRLADKAQDPLLKALMRGQAIYEDAYADRLPNYQPSDGRLWTAAVDFANAVNSMCNAVAPR